MSQITIIKDHVNCFNLAIKYHSNNKLNNQYVSFLTGIRYVTSLSKSNLKEPSRTRGLVVFDLRFKFVNVSLSFSQQVCTMLRFHIVELS